MEELKKEFNIHITKEPMIKQYYKAVLAKYKRTGVKPHGCSMKRYAKKLMESYCSKDTCGGFILDYTGDMKLNYLACVKHYNIYVHKSVIGQMVAIISHEFMHYLLDKEQEVTANSSWDNIAHELECDGYLGSE